MKHLRDTYFYVTVVQSCPTACEFSRIAASMVYQPSPTEVSALDLFETSQAMLEGREADLDVRAPIQRLQETLTVDALIPGLVTSIMEEPTERLLFLTVADTILRRLTPVFEVKKPSYSMTSLVDRYINPAISPRFMGIGSLRTWRGHPDGRADIALTRPREHYRGQQRF